METAEVGVDRWRSGNEPAAVESDSGTPEHRIPTAAVLASLLVHRRLAAVLALTAAALTGLSAAGLTVWHCPVHSFLHLRCPGCGLTSAVIQLLSGHWWRAVLIHPFAPLVPFAALLLAAAACMPGRQNHRLAYVIGRLEVRFGLDYWLASGLIGFWLLRMMGMWPVQL